MDRSWNLPLIVVLAALLLFCCACFAILLGAALVLIPQTSSSSPLSWELSPTDTPVVIRPTPTSISISPTGTVDGHGLPLLEVPLPQADPAAETLQTLREAEIPINDPLELARRLEGKRGISPTLEPPLSAPKLGDQKAFWVINTDSDENFQVEARLRYITAHTYFWIETGVSYDTDGLARLAETFESQIYPTNREFFGSEWTPGVDGDTHLYILYVRGLGRSVVGLFSSRDVYPPEIQEFSNGHDMFLLNADRLDLEEDYAYGVLAHEFQHMIHWFRDRNESTWMNEGFSDLAMFLNGYNIGGHDYIYALNPDLQLNDWPKNHDETIPHYGASYLFLNYFLDRFGEEATQELVANPTNDLASIDQLLMEIEARDPLSGNTLNADDVFMDWVLTSFIQDEKVGDGRYTYRLYPDAPQPTATEGLQSCGEEPLTRDVHQYGVDYIRIQCQEDTTLHFEGSILVKVVPADPHSGSYAFWSNKGDESDMTLTRAFDFTTHSGPLTLSYWTWYDIEKDYDYVYLEASPDGENWQILKTPSGTEADPTGANYGWGYSGLSGGGPSWIKEEVDLSQFAGQSVYLRFEYITDAAVYGEGFLIDDIAIPEIGYTSDFEQDEGGWESAGFVRIQNILPQNFRLALITRSRGTTSVEYIPLSADNTADISLQFGEGVDEAILVVTGTTRFTRQAAAYRFNFSP